MTILVRPRAWWYNKVPLSVLLGLMLVGGRPFTVSVFLVLAGLVATVCCVANYGYALNELFDREEDRRAGRRNVAADRSNSAVTTIILLSAGSALLVANFTGGIRGLLATAVVLFLPLAYSVPPLRTKERGWLGVLCDAAAAHVYPALLALIIVSAQFHATPKPLFVLTIVVWAGATGLRGILSHQISSEHDDLRGGLVTVVHRIGRRRLINGVTFGLLPFEVLSFASLILQCDLTPFGRATAAVWVLYECVKSVVRPYRVRVFDRAGEPYIPFVDEGFYKAWGPLAFSLDVATRDPRYLVLAPIYFILFRTRLIREWNEIRATSEKLRLLAGPSAIEDRQSPL